MTYTFPLGTPQLAACASVGYCPTIMSTSVRYACSHRAALPFGTAGLRLRRETKRPRQWHLGAPMATAEDAQSKETDDLSDAYTDVMQQRMGGSLTYNHDEGMNYAKVLPDLYVGSCLQTAADAERLVEDEEIGTVFCLQQDSDMEYFSLDIEPILERCRELKSINHVRFRINDFDPVDLRNKLPDAVRALAAEQAASRGPAYVHCTAGMGRAPAVALAYMYWLKDFTLESAFEKLLEVRPCNPRLSAIRDATADLLYGGEPTPVTIAKHRTGTARSVQVAGLDVGWGQELEVPWDPERKCFRTVRMLRPGKYTYKWVIDGHWTYSADHSTMQDGDHINNYVEVVGNLRPAETRARARLVAEGGAMTPEERDRVKKLLLG